MFRFMGPYYGKLLIDQLNDGLVDRYVKRTKRHGTQRNILASVNILWNFAKEKRCDGPDRRTKRARYYLIQNC